MFWTVEKQYAKFLITMRMSFPMFWCSNHAPKEIQQSVIWIRIIIALDMLFFLQRMQIPIFMLYVSSYVVEAQFFLLNILLVEDFY